MRLNQKELKIVKLHEKGFDDAAIAKRLGYAGDLLSKGVDYVRSVIRHASAQKEVPNIEQLHYLRLIPKVFLV